MVTIGYDIETDIINILIEGPVSNQEIRKYLRLIAKEYKHKNKLYILSDYRKGYIKTDPGYFLSNLTVIKELFEEYFVPFKCFCNAFVIAPENHSTRTIIEQFVNSLEEVKSYHPEFFTTHNEAKAWLIGSRSKIQ